MDRRIATALCALTAFGTGGAAEAGDFTFDFAADPGEVTLADIASRLTGLSPLIAQTLNSFSTSETVSPTFSFDEDVTATIGDPAILGATGTLSTSGKIGFTFAYETEIGTFDMSADLRAVANLPDAPVAPGTKVSFAPDLPGAVGSGINSDFKTTHTAFATPDFTVSSTAFIDAKLGGSVTGCAFGFCGSATETIAEVDFTQEVFSVTPQEARVGPPDAVNVTIPFASTSGEIEVGLVPPFIEVDLEQGISVPFPQPFGIDIGGFEMELPTGGGSDAELPRGFAGTAPTMLGPVARLEREYLSFNADLDSLAAAQTAGLLPVLGGANFDIGVAGFSGDLWDFDATVRQSLAVELALNPDLKVELLFDRPVLVNGSYVNSWTGSWLGLPDFVFDETTTVTPDFFLSADLEFSYEQLLDVFIDVNLLRAEASVGPVTTNFGPALNEEISLLSDAPIISQGFKLSTLDPAAPDIFGRSHFGTLSAPSFTVAVTEPGGSTGPIGGGGPTSPSAIPLPAGLPMLLAALGVMVGAARRRAAG